VIFELVKTDGLARRGRLTTPHGVVETPAFMPVGTRGTVRSLGPDDLAAAGSQIVLANTYHLFMRPGHALIRELGGLHRFMAWPGPILTDSGGFQVWSLSKLAAVDEEGVRFRSPVDGSQHALTPEVTIEVQHALGADIIHPLDECLAYPAPREAAERSLELTLRWAARSKAAHVERAAAGQAMFGIVQGGTDAERRTRAARATVDLGFDGYAIGGMAVGEPKQAMYDLTALVASLVPAGQPRYLMGVGKPEDLVEAVARGVDMFDCVLPTRNARNGQAFTADGPVTLKQARYARAAAPLDAECTCYACRDFSRAYLRHLFMSGELLGMRLASVHAVHHMISLVRRARTAILERRYAAFRSQFLEQFASGETLARVAS